MICPYCKQPIQSGLVRDALDIVTELGPHPKPITPRSNILIQFSQDQGNSWSVWMKWRKGVPSYNHPKSVLKRLKRMYPEWQFRIIRVKHYPADHPTPISQG